MKILGIAIFLVLVILWIGFYCFKKNLKIEFGNAQHIGDREEQEDSFGFSDIGVMDKKGLLAVIADGMGGFSMGKEAGNFAVKTILNEFEKKERNQSMFDFLNGAVAKANRTILEISKNNKGTSVGTTIVAVTIQKNKLHWAAIGDSRLYILRKNKLQQLTTDHVYNNIIKRKRKEQKTIGISELERKNDLTSYLGNNKIREMNYNLEPYLLKRKDVLMLCTDGIYDSVENLEIAKILKMKKHPNEKAEKLIKSSIDAGHSESDNMTAIVLELR